MKAIMILVVTLVLITPSCIFRHRLNAMDALTQLKDIRTAEKQFFEANRRYGTFQELPKIEMGRASKTFDHTEGFEFRLAINGEGYSVVATPTSDAGVTLFMDQTGVIRAESDSNKTADKSSEPIRNQE